MSFIKKHWMVIAAAAVFAMWTLFAIRLFGQTPKAGDLAMFIVLSIGLLLVPVALMGEQILRKIQDLEPKVAAKSRGDTSPISKDGPSHRHELERSLVSGAACQLAHMPWTAREIAEGIKTVLDKLCPVEVDARSLRPDAPFKTAPLDLPVIDPGPDALEREIQAKASAGPRVTKEDIEAEITHEHYFTADQGARHPDAVNPRDYGNITSSMKLLTLCVLKLKNGFTVTGESACVSPENFNAEIGRGIARENAVNKIWPLLGFRLRDELARPVLTEADALADLNGTPRPSA